MLKIRAALPTDVDEIILMCAEHAEYERADFNPTVTLKSELINLIFIDKKLKCLVAVDNDQLVGYTTCALQVSTWMAQSYLYMDCLYIREQYRGKGLGTLFMMEVAKMMKDLSLVEIQFQTPDFNSGAIAFYEKLGAIAHSKKRYFWKP